MPTYVDEETGKKYTSDSALTDSELEELFGGGQTAPKGQLPKAKPPKAAAAIQAELNKKVAPDKPKQGLMDLISNIPRSAANVVKGAAQFATDTINMPADIIRGQADINPTWSGIGSTVAGLGKALTTQNPLFGGKVNPEDVDVQRAMGLMAPVQKAITNPAGIPEQLKQAAIEDPIGMAMNVSGAAGLVGKAAGASGLARTASALGKVSSATDPINVAGQGIGKISDLSKKVMQSTLKPSTKLDMATREQVIQKMLDNGYTVSEKGLRNATRDYRAIGDDIDAQIAAASKSGGVVDVNQALKSLDRTREFYKDVPKAEGYLADIEKFKNNILEETANKYGSAMMPIQDAQNMKRKIYQLHKKHYGDMKGIEIEMEKDLANGLMSEISKQYPAVNKLNKESAIMGQLKEELRKAVVRTRNGGAMSLPKLTGAGVAAYAGGIPAMALTYALQHPRVKSILAIAGNKAKYAKGMSREAGMATNVGYQGSKLGEDNNGVQ